MLLKNLLELLKDYNPEANVTLTTSEDIELSFIGEDKYNARIIFIEGCDTVKSCYYYNEEYCNYYGTNCEEITECEVHSNL